MELIRLARLTAAFALLLAIIGSPGAAPAASQTSTSKTAPTVIQRLSSKLPRLAGLPRKTVLPPLSQMKPQMISGSGTTSTTLGRTKGQTKKSALDPQNEAEDAAGRFCTTREVRESKGEDDKIVLGNQTDKIYPGAIYRENAVLDGSYNPPVNLQRRPYGIVTSLFSTASTGSSYVEVQPTPGDVYNGIATLMKNNSNVVNASNVAVDVSQIFSLEQLAFELQAGYQGYGVDLAADFAYSKENEKRIILARLTQVYFSVMLNSPDGSVLVSNAPGTLPANATYVHKVNYGRLGILKIETSRSAEEIQAALDFRYSQANQAVDVESEFAFKKIFEDLKITGFFFGGDATNGMVSVNCSNGGCAAKLDEFNQYVRNGLRLNTLVAPTPISYELKFLDDSSTAAVNSTTTYTERNCEAAKDIAVTLNGISIESVHRARDGKDCSSVRCNSDCGYAWGHISVQLEERRNGRMVGVVPATLNGEPAKNSTIWYRPQRDRQHGIPNYKQIKSADDINNVNTTFVYRLDPRIYAAGEYFLKATIDIKTNHKDNHLATLAFHGMKAPVVRDDRLENTLFDSTKPEADQKYGSWIVGPFSSESNRLHSFRAHFTVKPQ